MGNGTAETEWPSSTTVSEEKKAFLDNYFGLLDTNEAAAIDRLAELFTEDGCMITPAGKVEGPEQIRNSRTKAWDVIKTRSHKLMRVYAFDSDANDLLAIGSAVQGLANGKSISGEWVARIRFEEEQAAGGKLKIELHQVWADFGGAHKALQEALSG